MVSGFNLSVSPITCIFVVITQRMWMYVWNLKNEGLNLPLHRTCSCVCVWGLRTVMNTRNTFVRCPVSEGEAASCQSLSPEAGGCLCQPSVKTSLCRGTWWRGRETPATPPSQPWWRCRAPPTSGRLSRRRCWQSPNCPPPALGGCPPQTLLSDCTDRLRSLTCGVNKGAISRSTENIQHLMFNSHNKYFN